MSINNIENIKIKFKRSLNISLWNREKLINKDNKRKIAAKAGADNRKIIPMLKRIKPVLKLQIPSFLNRKFIASIFI